MRSGLIRRYYYDRLDLVAGYDASNSLLVAATFGPGIDQPISLAIDGEVYHYHADALGSVYQMTNSTQSIARTYDYSAFGKIISESGTLLNPFTYTGREYDSDSGLYYYRARYYDANVGRFISEDPIGLSAGINRFIYSKNRPLKYIDPYGYCDISYFDPIEGEIIVYKEPPINDPKDPPEIPEWLCEIAIDIGCHSVCEPALAPIIGPGAPPVCTLFCLGLAIGVCSGGAY